MNGRATRAVLTFFIDALIVVGIVAAIRLVIIFSAGIASQNWAQAVNAIARHLVIPFGAPLIRTPYHGVFDVDNALTVIAIILVEWGLSAVRDRA